MTTFLQYLKRQKHRKDAIGDLAHAVVLTQRSKPRPRRDSFAYKMQWLKYLTALKWIDYDSGDNGWPLARAAFHKAWDEYREPPTPS